MNNNIKVSAPSDEMLQDLEAKRSWVYGHYTENGKLSSMNS